jgi:hypothetical protein
MKMAPTEVHNIGALGAAVTYDFHSLNLAVSGEDAKECLILFVIMFSPLYQGVSLSAFISFWLCISFVNIEAGLMKIHYLKIYIGWK